MARRHGGGRARLAAIGAGDVRALEGDQSGGRPALQRDHCTLHPMEPSFPGSCNESMAAWSVSPRAERASAGRIIATTTSQRLTLAADEFIRRFLLQVLPDGFHRSPTTAISPTVNAPPSAPIAAVCWRPQAGAVRPCADYRERYQQTQVGSALARRAERPLFIRRSAGLVLLPSGQFGSPSIKLVRIM